MIRAASPDVLCFVVDSTQTQATAGSRLRTFVRVY